MLTDLQSQYSGFLNTPSLLEYIPNTFDPFLVQQDKIPSEEELKKHIHIHPNEVLGKRVEHFFEYYIKTHSAFELLRSGIQVFKEKQTIGELDFLVKNKATQSFLHIELVYKFYIYDPTIAASHETGWIGPNRKDSYDLKSNKLLKKQLPLLYNEETEKILASLNLSSQNFEQRVCFLTQLYLPLHMTASAIFEERKPPIAGFWTSFHDFKNQFDQDAAYYLPLKKEWIINPAHGTTWISFVEILSQIEQACEQKKSPMVWIKTKEDQYQKIFITWW
ncbi:hypothetical protein BD809_10837 [Aquimarina intermedia]|uniref:DUF1853 family protein n=1 Tax=Aquimarina intermedia TaxID=350814 RepID=A0A5S5BX70_9FLAO|nr:hypothetical protein BD809_10837 [Aquimarina intermedia]